MLEDMWHGVLLQVGMAGAIEAFGERGRRARRRKGSMMMAMMTLMRMVIMTTQ